MFCILVAFDFQFVSRASWTEHRVFILFKLLSHVCISFVFFSLTVFPLYVLMFFFFFFFFFFFLICARLSCLLGFPHCRLIVGVVTCCFNPFLPSGLFHPYQLDESISIFRGGWCIVFYFYFIFDTNSYKQTVKTLTRRRVPQCLIWVCTVCLCPNNGTLG